MAAAASAAAPEPVTSRQLFAQALALLEREQPDGRADRLFDLLNWLVSGALALTALYLVLVLGLHVDFRAARPLAWIVAGLYLLIIPACLLNVRIVRQLRRVASLQRRWAPFWTRRFQDGFKKERDQAPVAGLALLLLLGTASVLAGAAGLVFELTGKRDSEGFLLVLVLAAFGLSCLFLCYVTHGRRRLRVIADLRAKLEAGTPDAFDTIAGYNREQINTAREHAIKAEARRGDAGGYTYLQNPAVRDAKQALDTAELMAVLSHGARVIEDPPETQGQTRYDPIEGTHLELGYTVDRAARQVTFTWLAREGTARPASPREESPSDADSTYRISLTPSAKVSAASLSAEQRAAADAMIIDVASDPARYSHLTRPTKEGQLVLPLPFPSLELTYSVDQAARVVNVVHMSSPIPAQRIMFVSYSHEDTVVYEKIMEFVGELEKEGLLQIWSDKLIRPGDRWDDEIKKALERAQSALLLVSQKFVCSAYITRNELPYLLGRALEETNPLKIFWVPVTDSTVDSSYPAITTFQSLLTPLTPTLEDLTREGKLNEALKKIFSNLRELLLGQDKVERLA